MMEKAEFTAQPTLEDLYHTDEQVRRQTRELIAKS